MKKSRYSEEQVIGILREGESGTPVKTVCAKHNISDATYYAWKRKYGGMDVSEARRLRALEGRKLPLEATGGRSGCSDPSVEGSELKKMVSPSTKRRAAKVGIEGSGSSTALACRALGLTRSGYYRSSRESVQSRRIRKELIELSLKHPRYGYRRITALLRRDGFEINPKRVARIRREEGLKVSKRQKRTRRVGVSTAERLKAERARHVWSWDFVEDQTENGSRFRILTLIDEYTRECLATHAAWSIRAVDVISVVEAAIERYGAPEHIRSDNGPEFIAHAIQDWLSDRGVKTLYITPGSPWENGHIESFHDKFRDECLNRELFGSLLEARVIVESWRMEYNEKRPHSSPRYLTPNEYVRRHNPALRSAYGLPTPRVAIHPTTIHNISQPIPSELQF